MTDDIADATGLTGSEVLIQMAGISLDGPGQNHARRDAAADDGGANSFAAECPSKACGIADEEPVLAGGAPWTAQADGVGVSTEGFEFDIGW